MIFLSVGTQLPFPRAVRYLEQWLREQPVQMAAFGQVAVDDNVASFPTVRSLAGGEFIAKVEACEVLVSHAGMGNIITALERGRPIVIVPRLAGQGEHRNDHQVDTANRFQSYDGVFVASDFDGFKAAMAGAMAMRHRGAVAAPPERARLSAFVKSFVSGGPA